MGIGASATATSASSMLTGQESGLSASDLAGWDGATTKGSTNYAGIYTGLGGAVTSAIGSYASANAQRSSLDYQSSVAQFNAKVAGWQASDVIRNGQTAEENQDLKTGQMIGAQRAALAANGVDLGSGNATDILATSKFMGQRDALQIHDNAMMQAWGYRTQQSSYLANASTLKGMEGNINPMLSAGTSLLTGATNVAKNWDMLAKVNGTADFGTSMGNAWSNLWK